MAYGGVVFGLDDATSGRALAGDVEIDDFAAFVLMLSDCTVKRELRILTSILSGLASTL
jgi:hypothetical protein